MELLESKRHLIDQILDSIVKMKSDYEAIEECQNVLQIEQICIEEPFVLYVRPQSGASLTELLR